MKKVISFFIFLAIILGLSTISFAQVQCNPDQELVSNGGFESPVLDMPWNIFPSGYPGLSWTVEWMPGVPTNIWNIFGDWIDRPNPAQLELQKANPRPCDWTPAEGSQYAELDTDWNGPIEGYLNGEPASVRIYEDLPTIPGETYHIRYQFSPRPYTDAGDNKLEFSWNGDVKDVLSAAGSQCDTIWTTHEYSFTATSWSTRIQFSDLGYLNSLGTFLDDVSVRCVPQQAQVQQCGNGILETGEQCDDGNNADGDGCSSTCQPEQHEVPEFTTLGAGLVLAGAGAYMYRKRKK